MNKKLMVLKKLIDSRRSKCTPVRVKTPVPSSKPVQKEETPAPSAPVVESPVETPVVAPEAPVVETPVAPAEPVVAEPVDVPVAEPAPEAPAAPVDEAPAAPVSSGFGIVAPAISEDKPRRRRTRRVVRSEENGEL
ncbi:MAG: hypothetical protein IK038_02615 [Bacteroidaceae bacterium]|nr:hypothetical protein [Bacteroidaceae bacterium]